MKAGSVSDRRFLAIGRREATGHERNSPSLWRDIERQVSWLSAGAGRFRPGNGTTLTFPKCLRDD